MTGATAGAGEQAEKAEKRRFFEPPVTETTTPFWDATRRATPGVAVVHGVRRARVVPA